VGLRAEHRGGSRALLALWVVLVAALSPLWLGPALTPVLVAVAEAHHVCACGMAVGTCGCPECDRVEHDRLSRTDGVSKVPRPYPVLKGECDQGQAVLSTVAVPPSVIPASFSLADVITGTMLETPAPAVLASLEPQRPPLPPPRGSQIAV
jgi:hypothetical protein